MVTSYTEFQQQVTTQIINLIESNNLEMCYFDNYYKTGDSRIFEIGDKTKTIRAVISDQQQSHIEYGKTTYGKNRFIKRAKVHNINEEDIIQFKDILYPLQDIFVVKFELSDVAGLIGEIKVAFDIK